MRSNLCLQASHSARLLLIPPDRRQILFLFSFQFRNLFLHGSFGQSSFWKAARARFTPVLCEKTLPGSLCQAFGVDRRDRLLDLLKFLSPITTDSVPLGHLI
jgi:hypothetical protein